MKVFLEGLFRAAFTRVRQWELTRAYSCATSRRSRQAKVPEGEDGSRARRTLAAPQRRSPVSPPIPFRPLLAGRCGGYRCGETGESTARRPAALPVARAAAPPLPRRAPARRPQRAPADGRPPLGRRRRGRARHAPHPGIPCARSPRLGSAAALRLHSRHGCLQQISHRAPFRHCRRHGRRLRAALPAQQAAGRGPARVSRTGRGAKGRGRAAVVRGAGRDGVGPRGRARGSPCRGARCLRPSGPRPGEGAASAAPAPLLELYSLS